MFFPCFERTKETNFVSKSQKSELHHVFQRLERSKLNDKILKIEAFCVSKVFFLGLFSGS